MKNKKAGKNIEKSDLEKKGKGAKVKEKRENRKVDKREQN